MKKVLFVLLLIIVVCAVFIAPSIDMPIKSVAFDDEKQEPVPSLTTPAPTPSPAATPSLVPANSPVPTPDPTPPPKTQVSVAAVGDLMCLYGQLTNAKQGSEYVFDQCFEQVKPIISGADIAMGNFETLIAQSFPYTAAKKYEEQTIIPDDGSEPYTTSVSVGGNPKLNAPESFLSAVVNCGFDVLVTANNHAFDRKLDGIVETMDKLDGHGMLHTGSYASPEDKQPLVITKEGIRIGVVSYTDISNQDPRSAEAYMLDQYNEEKIAADIESTKQAGAEFVVVYIHWGSENTHKTTSKQRKMAQFIADAGADIILGSHSHCTQPFDIIETENRTVPVIYSLGNFISSMGRTINKDSVIVNFILEKNYELGTVEIIELTYTPTLCRETSAGGYIVLPTNQEYIETSEYASSLISSRERTIKVLGDIAATPK